VQGVVYGFNGIGRFLAGWKILHDRILLGHTSNGHTVVG
jgi:hypothetical protein